MYYIFAFKSRTSAMNFYENLRRRAIPSTVINTPPAAQLGCGLSVKIAPCDLNIAQQIFASRAYHSYLGTFKITYTCGRYEVVRA